MSSYRVNSAPFLERSFYTLEVIEQMCWDELNATGLYPTSPSPIRIDRFIEKRFNINISYEDLPLGLLGFTEFGKKGVAAVVISKSLDDSTQSSERRLRTTLAHEAGHGLLHAHLVGVSGETKGLFEAGGNSRQRRILCREDDFGDRRPGKRYDGRWWEFQANQAMASLLLPRELVEATLLGPLVPYGSLGKSAIASDQRPEAIKTLSDLFNVNPVVARLRLDVMFPENVSGQLTF